MRVSVTRADRQMASGVLITTKAEQDALDGKLDSNPVVQAFAKHRIASQAALLKALEAACNALIEAGLTADNTDAYINGRKAIAQAGGEVAQ